MRLENRTALITGGTSGIGEATCLLFGEEGASVAVVGRNAERGKNVAKQITDAGGTAVFVQADVRKSAECRTAVDRTVETFGRLDILFNNAGTYYANDVLDCTEEEWDDQVETSLKGTFLMSKYALPHMIERGSGSIINCASGWGLVGGAKAVAYCAAKGGMVVMTKAMAIDHGPQGIRVNAVCPGDTDTPMEHEDARNQGLSWEAYVDQMAGTRPIARLATPEEIARAVLFLASDESSYITGAALPVDGGGVAG
ncbi:MAG TPA: SDR family NAD(P)-dependent oxidoreductase [Actinomycetota bacterium]|nr:SDR family NAD(P)-dependent oxidoreductase [Actinomycetota bacterium]